MSPRREPRPELELGPAPLPPPSFPLHVRNDREHWIDPEALGADEIVVAIRSLAAEAARRSLVVVGALGPVRPDQSHLATAVRLVPTELLDHLVEAMRGAEELLDELKREQARRSLASLLPQKAPR